MQFSKPFSFADLRAVFEAALQRNYQNLQISRARIRRDHQAVKSTFELSLVKSLNTFSRSGSGRRRDVVCHARRIDVPWMASEQLETIRSEKNFGGCALKCFWS
jgi:hypothetical protein